MHCFICSNLDSRSRCLTLWLSEHSCSHCNSLARKQPRHTCRGWWFEVAVGAAGLCQEDQIWAGHQMKHFKSTVLTFMASVYARSCTLTYTFLLCRVEGLHVSDRWSVCCLAQAVFFCYSAHFNHFIALVCFQCLSVTSYIHHPLTALHLSCANVHFMFLLHLYECAQQMLQTTCGWKTLNPWPEI